MLKQRVKKLLHPYGLCTPSSKVLKEDEEVSVDFDQLSPPSIHLHVSPSYPVNKAHPVEVTASDEATFDATKPVAQVFAVDPEALAAALGDDVPLVFAASLPTNASKSSPGRSRE